MKREASGAMLLAGLAALAYGRVKRRRENEERWTTIEIA